MNGDHRFSADRETILMVMALTQLGDALQRGLADSEALRDVPVSVRWRYARHRDGLPPTRAGLHDPEEDSLHERRMAAWLANRIGMDAGDYLSAVTWEAAARTLLERLDGWDVDGLEAHALGFVPGAEDVRWLAEIACRAAPVGGGNVDAWVSRAALVPANGDAFALAYYRHWPERRSWTVAEIAPDASRAAFLREVAGRLSGLVAAGTP